MVGSTPTRFRQRILDRGLWSQDLRYNLLCRPSRLAGGKVLVLNLARTKSHRKYNVGREARRRARLMAGPPPAERVIPDKRRKPPKHKKKLIEELL